MDEASERLVRVLLGDPRSRYVPAGLLTSTPAAAGSAWRGYAYWAAGSRSARPYGGPGRVR
ncbi:hypothetical protein [Micromonospora kangleipakensis]|uniref:hypothetical protein n=1 Tax=Micromonospora kangleipakensis TaxID=1077942 RepID=UPI001F5F3C5C|nr:hypothetical protein [Micromonospora kangleipakensis]